MSERRAEAPPFVEALVRDKRVIVCCGAGGVGKTTTAAAIGVAAARAGRRVLVLTIDPARRLSEAMNIPESGPEPARVARISPGTLHAWMLDPRVVFEGMVRRLTTDPEKIQNILENRLYRTLSDLVSGMQEYTAAEALFTFVESGAWDLVVLDTPPSRNALEFLEAPRKLALFLDERIVGVFMPQSGASGFFARQARQLVANVFARVFGEGFFEELQEFLGAFSGMFAAMRAHSEAVRELLTSDRASFLVVTSPEPSALEEGRFLEQKLCEMGLPVSGYVLNRSWAFVRGFGDPESIVLPHDATRAERAGLAKLARLADTERALAARDRALVADLAKRAGAAHATPYLGAAIEDFAGLVELADSFLGAAREP